MRTLRLVSMILAGFLVTASSVASAGHWVVTYSFTGDGQPFSQSFVQTMSPLGSDLDPLHGQITVHYDALSTGAPISGARIVSGYTDVSIVQVGGFTITGMSHTDFLPGTAGTSGAIGDGGDVPAGSIRFSPIADTALTGFLHCTNGTFPCGLGGFTASVNVPQTPTGPGPFPLTFNDWIFTSGTAGVGRWNSPGIVDMLTVSGQTVTVTTVYNGREISRTFVPEPAGAALAALLCLAALRRSRRA